MEEVTGIIMMAFLFTGVVAIIVLVAHAIAKSGNAKKKMDDVSRINELMECPGCHGLISVDADSCPNCGKISNLFELKKKARKANIILTALLFVFLSVGISSYFIAASAEKKVEELEEKKEKIDSDIFEFTGHTLAYYEKNGFVDTIRNLGGREILDEIDSYNKKCETFDIILGVCFVLFIITTISYIISGKVNSSRLKKYMKSIKIISPNQNYNDNGNGILYVSEGSFPQIPSCQNCGSQLTPGVTFCPMCGNRVQ